jgi:hypothetical protein
MYNTGWIKWNDRPSVVRWPGVSPDTAASTMPSYLTYWYWKNFCLSSTLTSLHWRDISYWHLLRNKLQTICKNQFPQNLMATAGGTPADHRMCQRLVKYQLIPKHTLNVSKTCQLSADTQAYTECVEDLSSISWYPSTHWMCRGLVKYQLIPKHTLNVSKTCQLSADTQAHTECVQDLSIISW